MIIIKALIILVVNALCMYLGYAYCEIKICKIFEKIWWDMSNTNRVEQNTLYPGVKYVDRVFKKIFR